MNNTIFKILVACHKPDSVLNDNVYTPIHVGRAVSNFKTEMSHMIGDDTGDNISDKNPFYCELTAQYWAWKNLKADYVGLAHYRRYFKTDFSNNIDSVFKGCDIILGRKLYEKYSMADKIALDANIEDLYIFVDVIKRLYPEYINTVIEVLSNNVLTPCNMFIMRKHDFDNFAHWQFDILFEVEKSIKYSSYTRPKRVIGYISEIMLYIFAKHNHYRIKYETIVDLESNPILSDKYSLPRRVFVNIGFKLFNKRVLSFTNAAVLTGLKNDGIIINNL